MAAAAGQGRCLRSSRRGLAAVCVAAGIVASPIAGLRAVDTGGPSFDCAKVEAGSVPALVCADAGLAAADRNLVETYAAAIAKAASGRTALRAEQRGWIEGRDDCWQSDDRRACVADAYRRRIAELQARYRLLPPVGTATYLCGDGADDQVTASFFATDPPTAVVRRRAEVSLMYQQPAASGARYQGPNDLLWEHQGEALISWGYGAPEMRCRLRR